MTEKLRFNYLPNDPYSVGRVSERIQRRMAESDAPLFAARLSVEARPGEEEQAVSARHRRSPAHHSPAQFHLVADPRRGRSLASKATGRSRSQLTRAESVLSETSRHRGRFPTPSVWREKSGTERSDRQERITKIRVGIRRKHPSGVHK